MRRRAIRVGLVVCLLSVVPAGAYPPTPACRRACHATITTCIAGLHPTTLRERRHWRRFCRSTVWLTCGLYGGNCACDPPLTPDQLYGPCAYE